MAVMSVREKRSMPTIRRCRCLTPDEAKQRQADYGLPSGTSARGDRTCLPPQFYRYSPDRKGAQAVALLKGCNGFLHADAYAGFNPLYEINPKAGAAQLAAVACWAHARRKIYEVHDATGSPAAKELLERIGNRQTQRPRPGSLAPRCHLPHRRSPDEKDRRAPAVE